MSAATGPNTFSKASGLTQPIQNTKAVVGYHGNINFEKESLAQNLSRKTGPDLITGNL